MSYSDRSHGMHLMTQHKIKSALDHPLVDFMTQLRESGPLTSPAPFHLLKERLPARFTGNGKSVNVHNLADANGLQLG